VIPISAVWSCHGRVSVLFGVGSDAGRAGRLGFDGGAGLLSPAMLSNRLTLHAASATRRGVCTLIQSWLVTHARKHIDRAGSAPAAARRNARSISAGGQDQQRRRNHARIRLKCATRVRMLRLQPERTQMFLQHPLGTRWSLRVPRGRRPARQRSPSRGAPPDAVPHIDTTSSSNKTPGAGLPARGPVADHDIQSPCARRHGIESADSGCSRYGSAAPGFDLRDQPGAGTGWRGNRLAAMRRCCAADAGSNPRVPSNSISAPRRMLALGSIIAGRHPCDMPLPERTSSGRPRSRARLRHALTAGWCMPRRMAARETLRSGQHGMKDPDSDEGRSVEDC